MNREYVVVDDGAGGFQLVDVDDNTKIIARSTEGRLWTLVDPSGQDTNQSIEFETALTEGFTVRAAGDSTQIKLVGNLALAEQGSIYFNADGSFNRAVSNAPDGSMAISLNPELADPMAIELDFSSFTQFADTMTARFLHQNGYANGTLESFSIDQNGRIVGSFSNGLTRNLGQIALARFANTGAWSGLVQPCLWNRPTRAIHRLVRRAAWVRQHLTKFPGDVQRGLERRVHGPDHYSTGIPGQFTGHYIVR